MDFGAFMRREPIVTANGATLVPVDAATEAALIERINSLPSGPMKAFDDPGAYQAHVFGPDERIVTFSDGSTRSVDGFTAQYGIVAGDAKYVGNPSSSFYIPESMPPLPRLQEAARAEAEDIIAKLHQASLASGGDGTVEIATNNVRAAEFFESVMRQLDVRGYARIAPAPEGL